MPELTTVDALTQLSFLVQGTLEQLASEHEASIVQVRLLGVLRDRTPTMNELARLLGLDKSSVTGLIDRAERRALVERVPSADDRRAVLVRLTRTGRSLVTKVSTRFDKDVTAMLAPLSSTQRATLTQLASRVLVAHAAEHGVELFPTTYRRARDDRSGSSRARER